jgi:hypothetical protein
MNAVDFWTQFAASFCALVTAGYVVLWQARRMARAFIESPEFQTVVDGTLKHVAESQPGANSDGAQA